MKDVKEFYERAKRMDMSELEATFLSEGTERGFISVLSDALFVWANGPEYLQSYIDRNGVLFGSRYKTAIALMVYLQRRQTKAADAEPYRLELAKAAGAGLGDWESNEEIKKVINTLSKSFEKRQGDEFS